MGDRTEISWADSTFNPWEGCQRVGPGCDHCYAEARNARFGGGAAVNWGPGAPRRRTSTANWRKPLQWEREHEAFQAQHGRRRRVFCASLADVFDNQVPVQWRMDLFSLIAETPHLEWLILTKRVGNVMPMCSGDSLMFDMLGRNVWLGATVVNQEEADRDIPKLLAVPARVRFLSVEPMLGPVDLRLESRNDIARWDSLGRDLPLRRIDWVICGGESGPGARHFNVEHARSIVAQCKTAGVAVLVKQLGARPVYNGMPEPGTHWPAGITFGSEVLPGLFQVNLRDKKGGDWSEWPEDLRVREFPQ